jgi:hypothetical protein
MKYLAYAAIITMVFALPAYSQVDTLTAVEIQNIQLPDSITRVYTQNFDNDIPPELVLCSPHRIYIYNAGETQPIWIGSQLDNPRDLQFADLNHDSNLDIAVRTDSGISFFHPPDTSAFFDIAIPSNVYKCYTLGDANWDSLCDIVFVRQEPFNPGDDPDTVWLNTAYGPDFTMGDSSIMMLENYDQSPDMWSHFRNTSYVSKIFLANLGFGPDSPPRIIMNVAINNISEYTTPGDPYYAVHRTGAYYLMEPMGFSTLIILRLGLADTIGIYDLMHNQMAFSTCSASYYSTADTATYGTIRKRILKFSTDMLEDSLTVISETSNRELSFDWSSCFGDMNSSRYGIEYCYAYNHTLFENSLVYNVNLWSTAEPSDSVRVICLYHAPDFLSAPNIIVKSTGANPEYIFIDGRTDEIDGVLQNPDFDINLVSDIDGNGTDEILSIAGNSLSIFTIEQYTGINRETGIPDKFQLLGNYPNPFNAQTIIKYNLPRQSDIVLEIFDILGRKVESLEKPNQPAGFSQIMWDASSEPSGTYYYRLSVGNERKIGRMLLLK